MRPPPCAAMTARGAASVHAINLPEWRPGGRATVHSNTVGARLSVVDLRSPAGRCASWLHAQSWAPQRLSADEQRRLQRLTSGVWPAVVVGCGRQAARATAAVRAQSTGATIGVQLQVRAAHWATDGSSATERAEAHSTSCKRPLESPASDTMRWCATSTCSACGHDIQSSLRLQHACTASACRALAFRSRGNARARFCEWRFLLTAGCAQRDTYARLTACCGRCALAPALHPTAAHKRATRRAHWHNTAKDAAIQPIHPPQIARCEWQPRTGHGNACFLQGSFL